MERVLNPRVCEEYKLVSGVRAQSAFREVDFKAKFPEGGDQIQEESHDRAWGPHRGDGIEVRPDSDGGVAHPKCG